MPHTTDRIVQVDSTSVKIATGIRGAGSPGESQTVNVFDHSKTEGNYQQVYRITDSAMYVDADLVEQKAPNLHELDRYLATRGAVKEGPRLKP